MVATNWADVSGHLWLALNVLGSGAAQTRLKLTLVPMKFGSSLQGATRSWSGKSLSPHQVLNGLQSPLISATAAPDPTRERGYW